MKKMSSLFFSFYYIFYFMSVFASFVKKKYHLFHHFVKLKVVQHSLRLVVGLYELVNMLSLGFDFVVLLSTDIVVVMVVVVSKSWRPDST